MQQPIYHPPVYQPPIHQPQPQVIYQPQPQIIYQPQPIQTPTQNPAQMTSGNPRSRVTQNWKSVMIVHQLIPSSLNSPSGLCTQNLDISRVQNPNSQHYLSLLVTPENVTSNNTEFNQYVPTNTILPATISSDESLATIFPFKLEENTPILLFSGAALKEKPITAMYTDAKVNGHFIKLILDSGSAGSIITRQLMDQLGCRVDQAASARIITANGVTKTLISEIDDFPFEVNGIVTPIKVLVMEAIQYQALIGNNWLSKANATLDWNTQELQLIEKLLIELEEKKKKPTWEAYQVLWADEEHNELPLILFWDNNNKEKGKQKEELIRETDDLTWTDNDESELTSKTTQTTTAYNTYTTPQRSTYHRPKLICVNCGKKLLSMGACCRDNEEYSTATRFYCRPCILECFRKPKQVGKWDNQSCLACGETLLDEGMWHDIPECGETCDISCQYMILISDWVRKKTPIEAAWRRAVQQLNSYPHDDDKIWQMALAKIEEAMPEEIKTIKDNPPEPLKLDWDAEPIINLLDLEQFHEHYQELAPTREEQEQQLEQLNTQLCQYCLISCDF
ncbi:hypothetical protein G9A89_002980 [Geosiphon pyriformis]|nr:hypothetical protein G9A89_002980 [Geosiphon pyriformis]